MFDNDFLDRFSRVHHFVPLAIFLPAIGVLLYLGFDREGTGDTLLLGVGGYLFWSLSEYWIHRVIFHWEPQDGIGARLHWIIHGVHHDHPNDPLRLVMPPSASIPLATAFSLLFQALLPFGAACALSVGFFAGYLAYDMTHYYVHHRMPKSALGKKLRELHMRHHFQDHTKGYGISAPWWDVVFRTYSQRRKRAV
jgi:dihydroceramide fatty acyl 2-hydroxylase